MMWNLKQVSFLDRVRRILMLLGIIFWSLVAAVVMLMAFVYANLTTESQLRRVEVGMTKVEVHAILGQPDFTEKRDDLWYYWAWGTSNPVGFSFDSDGRLKSFK